ncbi:MULTISPECIES: SurA N-terminal domain-containing protein [Marinomonas]|uniref:Periplasmic chaperone PpiD n=1 Tax=Marinomonas arctica TaxID=383750 RepID=A0A7H1J2A4_9GAMM|nr:MULTISPECIES: SurA N-terminal domain-containing protein [Marinomonas]MCS7487858.1 peptidylprolyl isomerase [Marinomonas sp. BSi20414]QNT04620.1 SurA N-terminal domain-containing protein [Marinomonas arctica]GGN32726.1 peptidylprolyl isomerase [Marinomonas arctica]
MLQDIRDKSQGIVVKIIVGFIVVTFALFGVDALVQSFNSSDTVAEVDGVDISRTQMLQGAETQRRQLISMMGGQVNPALLEDNLLQRRALDELIQRVVLTNQAQGLGLGVSDEQVNAYLLQAEQFQTDGQFDQNKYLNFIRSLGFTPLAFKERIKQDVLIQQPRNAIAGSEFVLPYQVNSVAQLQSQQRSYDYVSFSLASESENTNVSEEELQAYYEANKDNFKTPEQVKVNYVVVSSADFYSKVNVTDAELQDAYQASIAGLTQEERSASHILIETSDRSDADAQKRVEEIEEKLNAGEAFADLAATYSDDIGSKDDGGNLGYVEKGTIDQAFDDALFSMQKDEVRTVKTQFGYHIIKLDDITQPDVPSFASLEADLKQKLLEDKARDALLTAHEDITDLAYASDKLDAIAKEYGVDVLQSAYFGRDGGSDEISSNPAVIAAAFDVPVLEDGQNSNLIELNEDQVVVIHLNDHKPESFQSYEETKEQVASIVVQNKAVESLRAKAEAAKDAEGTAWSSVSDAQRGQDEMTSLAFSMPHPDDKPVVAIKGLSNGDLALIRLNKVDIGSDVAPDEQQLAYERYLNQTQATLSTQGLQDFVKNNAKIER